MEENIPKNEHTKKEEDKTSKEIPTNELIKGLIQFFCSTNGASLIEKIFESKGNAINKENEYSFKKYWQDIIMVSVILFSILLIIAISAYFSPEKPFISETTIGTLLGGIIGYALARFKNRQDV